MYNQPYLETCCRSALHRLVLAGRAGRPAAVADAACLARLAGMGLARGPARGLALQDGERFAVTEAGLARHAAEIG